MLTVRHTCRLFFPIIPLIGGVAFLAAAWLVPLNAGDTGGNPSVRQFPTEGRATDCGAVALYFICKREGKECSLDDLRARVKTTVIGTDMYNLREGARSLGFKVDAVRCRFNDLRLHVSTAGNYAIVHSPLHSHFMAVVAAAEPDAILVADTVLGVKNLTDSDLRLTFGWDGAALLLAPKPSVRGPP